MNKDNLKNANEDFERLVVKELISNAVLHGHLEREAKEADFDFLLQTDRGSIAIEVKKMIPYRHKRALEMIAYYHLLSSRSQKGRQHWLVLTTDSFSSDAIHKIQHFVQSHEMKLGVILMDTLGHLTHIEKGKIVTETVLHPRPNFLKDLRASKANREESKKGILNFSGNQQWILKHLLLSGIDEKYWGAPSTFSLAKSTQLSQMTGVAQSACYETLRALKNLGFFTESDFNGYRLRKLNELLTLWKTTLSQQKPIEIYLRPVRPTMSQSDWWDSVEARMLSGSSSIGQNYTISGGAALKWYGMKTVKDFSLLLHVPSIQATTLDQLLMEFELSVSDSPTLIKVLMHGHGKSEVGVLKYRRNKEEPPYVDILQLALDSFSFGPRGSEQANRILNDILYPFWRKKDWSI